MKRFGLAAVFLFAFSNAPLLAANPADDVPPPPKPAETRPAPRADAGVRKLSRRERKERIAALGDKYRQFLTDVEPIMQPSELDTFLLLETDPQREVYIQDFWHRRDVAQGTTNNTFRDQYYNRLEQAKELFRQVSTDRSRVYLIQGEPTERIVVDCRILQPLEIWKYTFIQGMGHDVRFLFFKPRNWMDFRLWSPLNNDQLTDLVSMDAIGASVNPNRDAGLVFTPDTYSGMTPVQMQCKDGDEIEKAIAVSQLNKTDLIKVFEPPPINEEDVHKILHSVVIADPNAPKLSADFAVAFPARQGMKTDAEMTLMVPRAQLSQKDVNNAKLYSLDVVGEVLKDGQLWENYRYRFDYPADTKNDKLAVVIDRFLRPAAYQSRIKVRDINSGAEVIVEKDVNVPELTDSPDQRRQKDAATATVQTIKDAVESNATSLRIVPLPDDLLSGIQHIETIASGDAIKAVEFDLDGRKVMVKRQPPYTLDLDFGDVPRVRHVRAVALDEKGDAITGDEVDVNTGNDPFRVRIVSPRVALKVHGKTRVDVSVHVPDGKKLDHVDLFLNDTRVATMFTAPFVQLVDVPPTEGVGYIRAVASLKDDPQPPVEDLVMINTPQYMEEVNVHLVELPTTVIRNGHPINDLPQTAFKVLDEGKPVSVTKFEHVTNLPLSIGMAIDTSGSMQPRMSEAQKAGSEFLQNVMRKGDRAFLVAFDTQPQLIQRWSPQLADMNAGLAKLRAEESTALYDAIVYSLYNFLGVKGQKALVLITDGKDTSSKFSFEQAVEYARRAAVPIYAIGIGIRSTEVDTRYKLARFCSETGGNVYYIEQASDLARVYGEIQNELRSQYILGFYPPGDVKPGSKWHEVTVQVSEGRAKTIRGYYP